MPEIVSFFAVYLTVFLFGMTVMRIGLEAISKKKIKQYLIILTSSPLMGVVAGTLLTGLVQSSSAVMIITVGLVATGYLSFARSLGIILGANIGTTFTTELITIDISYGAVPLVVIGALLLFSSRQYIFSIGCICFGLGSIFVAMIGFEQLAKPFSKLPFVFPLFQLANEHLFVGIAFGSLITALIQSSTATTGIVMSFLNEEILTTMSGIAVMFGANVGTCFTAFLASIGTSREAKLVAYAHIWLNILGVILFYPFIPWINQVVQTLTTAPDVQLAHASLLFNVICTIIALPLIGYFSKFILFIHQKA